VSASVPSNRTEVLSALCDNHEDSWIWLPHAVLQFATSKPMGGSDVGGPGDSRAAALSLVSPGCDVQDGGDALGSAPQAPKSVRRLNVLIYVKYVVGIVLLLDRRQTCVVTAVGRTHALLPFAHHEVHVRAAGGERVQSGPLVGRPPLELVTLARVGVDANDDLCPLPVTISPRRGIVRQCPKPRTGSSTESARSTSPE
jgi:hypothetical protein